MDYPLKKVVETRVLFASSSEGLNEQLKDLQQNNDMLNGSVWEPHGDLVVQQQTYTVKTSFCYFLVINRYRVVTY